MIDLRQIYYNINFMSSNIYLLLQELGYMLNVPQIRQDFKTIHNIHIVINEEKAFINVSV